MGAGLSVDVGYALVAVSIKCLSGDFRRAMEILGELLRRPTFPADELERLKGQVLTDLKEMDDNTRVVSRAHLARAGLPVDAPLPPPDRRHRRERRGRHARRAERVSQRLVRSEPDHADGRRRRAARRGHGRRRAQPRRLAGRARSSASKRRCRPATCRREQLREVDMVGKTQADVAIGLPTLDRTSPDYYALSFANHILGRMYFMGRFGEKVRDEQGLAYYAYSELHGSYGRGAWLMRAGVNPRNLDQALTSIDAELKRFLADGPTPEEQTDGVSSLLGSLPRQLETNEGAAAVMGEIELYDLGLDYLERYPDIVRSLTARAGDRSRAALDRSRAPGHGHRRPAAHLS